MRNGEIWDVIAVHPDGSLSVARADRDRPATQPGPVVVLPAEYVANDVDLGYATTTHRAQGVTVDHAHVLAAAGMTRENLYVAMTRGRHHNHVYVALDAIDPSCDDLPDHHRSGDARDILERILATPGAEMSATQTIARALDDVASRDRLEPIRETLLAEAATRRWRRILPTCGLDEPQVEAIWASADRAPLVTALRSGEAAGFPMRDLVAWIATANAGGAHEGLARTLTDRVTHWLDRRTDERGAPVAMPGWTEPIDPSDSAAGPLREIDDVLAQRLAEVSARGTEDLPDWLPPEPGIENEPLDARATTALRHPSLTTLSPPEPWLGHTPPTTGPVR